MGCRPFCAAGCAVFGCAADGGGAVTAIPLGVRAARKRNASPDRRTRNGHRKFRFFKQSRCIERLQQPRGLIRFTGNLDRLTVHIQAADPTGRRYQLRDLRQRIHVLLCAAADTRQATGFWPELL